MLTAHAAKGMEFPNVYVCGCVDSVFPCRARNNDGSEVTNKQAQTHLQEERRVFYVAITRAEDNLTLTQTKYRRFGPEIAPCEASQFLTEAGDTIQHEDLTEGYHSDYGFRSMTQKPVRRRRKQRFRIPDGGADAVLRQKYNKNRR